MFALRLALLLCLVLPLSGLAQAPEPSEAPAPPATPPPLVPAPPNSQEPADEGPPRDAPRDEIIPRDWASERPSSPTAPRLLLEFLGGAVGGFVGIIPGSLLVLSALCFSGCDDGDRTRGTLGLVLGLAGYVAGTAGGIVGAATLVDGEGGYWSTAGGVALGSLVGGLLAGLFAQSAEGAAIIPALTGPIIGGMIGYELSHSNAESRRQAPLASGTRIVPVFSIHPSGGILGGLVGRF